MIWVDNYLWMTHMDEPYTFAPVLQNLTYRHFPQCDRILAVDVLIQCPMGAVQMI